MNLGSSTLVTYIKITVCNGTNIKVTQLKGYYRSREETVRTFLSNYYPCDSDFLDCSGYYETIRLHQICSNL